tara:strand:- start:127 stop:507 length:381 start_codon:yes stop_codon:yes gene_type:complete
MYEYYQIRNSTNLVDLKLSSVNPLIDNDNFSYIDLSTLPLDFDYSKRYMLVDGSLQVYEEPQIVVSDTILIRDVRNKRDRLLDESDWTQVPDSPANSSEWATYRQELRDITENIDLSNVTWPTPPE